MPALLYIDTMNLRGIILSSLLAACSALAEPRVTPANYQSLHQLMQPTADEKVWKQIPWMTRLWDARIKAAALGKPILLWEMDGNPMGCT